MTSECCWILKIPSFWLFNGFYIFINGGGVGDYHGDGVCVRGKLAGASSYSTLWAHGVRFGSKCPYLLSHLARPGF